MSSCRLFQIQEHVLRPRLTITVMNSLRSYVEWEANVLRWNWDRSSSTNNTITVTIGTITAANATHNDTSSKLKLQLPPPSEIRTFITILSHPIKLRHASVLLAGPHRPKLTPPTLYCAYTCPNGCTVPIHHGLAFELTRSEPVRLTDRAGLDHRAISET